MKTRFATLLAVLALTLGPAVFAADQDNKTDRPKEAKCCADCQECKCKAGECKCEKPKAAEKCCADCKDCKCKAGECKCEKPKLVVLTGSHIPQLITQHGRITDGINAVTVVSREDLEATGETNLAAALRKVVPAIR